MIEGPDGWWLTPEGAVVRPDEAVAVIADVHLGYEWSRGYGGDLLPAHSLAETLERLQRLFQRVRVSTLVVAGDLVESNRPCRRTDRDLADLRRWLDRLSVNLIVIRGNHDPARLGAAGCLEMAGWAILHGDRPLVGQERPSISGHLHPALRFERISAPCFLIDDRQIILPAFSRNAAGVPVQSLKVRRTLRCVAMAESELVDFGPLDRLIRTLG